MSLYRASVLGKYIFHMFCWEEIVWHQFIWKCIGHGADHWTIVKK